MHHLPELVQSLEKTSNSLSTPEEPLDTRFTNAILHTAEITDLIRDTDESEPSTLNPIISLPPEIDLALQSENPADYVAVIERLLEIFPVADGQARLQQLVQQYNASVTVIESLEQLSVELEGDLEALESRPPTQDSARDSILQREAKEIEQLETEIEQIRALVEG
ncbi:DASH complex subunit Spc34 [Schizosaccharomyces japonicus yFS275]|uniref:DASH complex subunit Spc34 n=1 Tax=Schizosaccharomyces japonicus (strain yFS275 / FY16936) TaxID=402676 RepID=B6K2J9_SCHJY|nr:DASH complex subunit Spc34 [Schizosaccharomyces japonicus yFS275]EEB07380.1 DASH complex subunit Spc34 [Schizosaccharomyces japonicus yFS275]